MRRSRIDRAGDFCERCAYARAKREPSQFAHLADNLHFASPLTVHAVSQLYAVAVAKQFQTAAELLRLFPKFEDELTSAALSKRLAALARTLSKQSSILAIPQPLSLTHHPSAMSVVIAVAVCCRWTQGADMVDLRPIEEKAACVRLDRG